MPTTFQMLSDYPDPLLEALAELRGAILDGADDRQQAVELLAAQITDPTSVQMAYQEVADMSDEAQAAVELLLKENGEMAEAQFSREHGSIRQMGPSKLVRETPWLYPENIAELLYYYGLMGRGFKGAGQNAHTIVYLPSDILPWLPHAQHAAAAEGLAVQPVAAPPASRTMMADSSFLEDMGTLIGFLHTETLRLTAQGPHPDDVDHLVQRLQLPFAPSDTLLNTRLALMLHLANQLGWLRRGEKGTVQLTGNRVRQFLERTRAEQRAEMWAAWRNSTEWNDLCRTPGLECTDTGAWQNDPLQSRAALLQLFARLQPGLWYSQDQVITAIKQAEPDFQRPTSNYDTWYIRDTNTHEFLKGFEHWDDVEGRMLAFLVQGPLHWLSAVDLAEPSAGSDMFVSLSQWGARWLGHDVPEPAEPPRRPLVVGEDFTIALPLSAPLDERFRVERFAQWQASYPQYVFQITKRSLQRAAEEGITPPRVIDFLRGRTRQIPPRVAAAIERYNGAKSVAQPAP